MYYIKYAKKRVSNAFIVIYQIINMDLYIGGRIGEDIYERKVRMMKEEEAGIKESIIRYSTMETEIAEIADIAEALIELAGNAKEIFTSSKPLAKNQFLRLLVSNCVLDNKKARISLSEPFNLLLKTPSCLMWSSIISKFLAENLEYYTDLKRKIRRFQKLYYGSGNNDEEKNLS